MSTEQPHRHSWIRSLLPWVAVTMVAAVMGGLGSRSAPMLYAQLDKPFWAPPAWVFGPVWTVLYLMMAVAAWIVWRHRHERPVGLALIVFLVQLVLNALWSWLFFAWQRGGAALAELGVLWVCVAATLVLFWRARRSAGILLLPYLAWVTFAGVLNASVWQRNPVLL